MSADRALDVSVVLPTDTWETIRPVVERLRRQTSPGRIEVILVVPSERTAGLERMSRDGLGRVVVVEVGDIVPLARARAAGVRAATAPLVFLGETHSYPHPGWAEAIVAAAERDGASVIVSGFRNANPNGVLSCAGFLSDYGGWTDDRAGGEIAGVPIFNSVYRRSVLLALGDRLEAGLGHGDELIVLLRQNGHRAVFEPRAKLDHLNIARAAPWIVERLTTGWLIGGNRAERWGFPRRLAYAAASPLIAVVLASRVLPFASRSAAERPAPAGTRLVMLFGAGLKAIGEAAGYLLGPSRRAEVRADELEVHKLAYAARGRS
jgi:hypothetical protein